MKKVLQRFFGKTLAIVCMLCAFALGGSAQITMSTANCTISADEIQMDILVTNNSAGDLRWNGTVLRFTVPASILPTPVTLGTYTWNYLGGSDFPASFPAPGVQAGGSAFNTTTRLLTWASTPTGAYNNLTCSAPLILPAETKTIGRFSFKRTNGIFNPASVATLVWVTTSSCNLYQACAGSVTAYSSVANRTLAAPCPLNTPADCSAVQVSGTATNANCFGASTGSITATTVGATGALSYTISGPTVNTTGASSGIFTGLSAGSYIVTVSDAGTACTDASEPIVVGQPAQLIGSESHTSVLCFGGSSTVTISATGGTGAYTGTGTFTQSAGTVLYPISDANGCTTSVSVTVTEPSQLEGAESHTAVACFGGSSVVTITASGGTPPYGGTGTFTQTAGTQSYTVTDFNGCTDIVSVTVTEPSQLVAAESHTPILCGGTSTVTISATGGTPPYSGTGTFSQGAGTQSYTVTDFNGCTSSVSVTVASASGPTAAASFTPILCFGGSSTVTVSATGGNPPYTGTGTFTVGAGSHTYTVQDFDGCPSSVTINISQPSQLNGSQTATPILCFGGTSTVTISASGGTPPYSGTGTFTQGAGLTNYTITDFNNCSVVVPVNLTQPTQLTASESHTAIACFGGMSTVTISASGGTPPYTGTGTFTQGAGTYNTTVTDFNGCSVPVSYTITQPAALTAPGVTVVQPTCSTPGTITVNTPAPAAGISYSIDGVNYSNTSGVFTIAPAGGTFNVTYQSGVCISPSTSATVNAQPATPPAPGITSVSNGNGTFTLCATIEPGNTVLWSTSETTPCIIVSPQPAPFTVTQSNGFCTSAPGSISQSNVLTDPAIGGMQLTTLGDVAVNSNTLLFSTTYKLRLPVYNLNQVEALPNFSTTVTVNLGKRLTMAAPPSTLSTYFTWTSAVNGFGETILTGSQIALIPADYADVAVFFVSGILSCTSEINANISATITDEDTNNNDAALTYNFPVTVSAVPLNVSCNGANNGSVVVTASPGTTIQVRTSPGNVLVGSGPVVTNLAPGVYTVTATATGDAGNTCLNTTTITISQPPVLSATATGTNANCYGGSNGTATAFPVGGTPSYSYSWNTVPVQTTQTAVGLAAGVYTVTITDANGCQTTANYTVTQPAAPLVITTSGNQVTCNGLSNGTAHAAVTGGTPPYTYSWNTIPVQTNATAVGLAAGNYTVTVTDANGCTASATRTVTQPLVISITTTSTNVNCFGGSNGSVSVATISGGTPGYTYTIAGPTVNTTGASSGVFTNLTAGTYVITATDASGCTATSTRTVTQPTALQLAPVQTNVNCFGGSNGTIVANGSGGTPPYSYTLVGPVTSTSATGIFLGLSAGSYNLTISDANGCTLSQIRVITQPGTAVSATASGTNILCYGNNTGTATANPAGGVGGYTYVWNTVPMQTTQTAVGLTAGTYTVTVTDANGCSASASYTVTQPAAALTVAASGTNISCYGAATGTATGVASGGTGTVTYTISGPTINTTGASSGVFTGLTAGIYTITATDANGCTASASYTVTQPASAIALALVGSTANTCNTGTAGTITVSASGGTLAYAYTIAGPTVNTTGAVTGVFTGLAGGAYTITVTDGNGCTASVTTTVGAPSGTTPDLTLGSDYNSNLFAINGVTNTIMFNVAEIGGNPAVGDTIRITKVAGYNITFNNAATSLTLTIPYTLNNPQWKIDNSNPAFVSMIKMHPSNPTLPGTIDCGTIERVSIQITRATPNISTFTLSSRIRRANGEVNLLNNLNSIVFTAE